MKRLIAIVLLLLLTLMALPVRSEEPLKLGVLAFRPKAQITAQWQPLAAYLETALGRQVELKAYDYKELDTALAQNNVDILLTNPGHYVLIKHRLGLSAPLATLVNKEGERELKAFGGVIFTRAEERSIASLDDLAGKRIAAVAQDSIGGYQMQAIELLDANVALPEAERLFITGMPQDKVVKAVLDEQADAGFVRTGLLEPLAREGKLDLSRIKIINRQTLPAFPFASSTRLYPEWPVIAMPHIDEHLLQRLTIALFSLQPDSIAARTAMIHGFIAPANYDSVETMLRRLRMPPYDTTPEFTLADLWKKYSWWIAAIGLLVLVLVVFYIRLLLATRARLRAMKQLTESERRLDNIIQSVDGIVWEADALTFQFTFVSAQAERLLGYNIERWLNEPAFWSEHLHYEDREQAVAYCKQATLNKSNHELDYRMVAADGRIVWLHDSVSVVTEGDQLVKLCGLMIDITERKQIEGSLRSLTTAIEQSTASVVITDLDANIQYVNPWFTKTTGYSLQEAFGKNPRILQSGQTSREIYDDLWSKLVSGREWHGELLNKCKSGELYWEDVRIAPVKNTAGAMTHYVAVKLNITAQKKAEAVIRDSEARFRTLFNSSGDVVLVHPLAGKEGGVGRFVEANDMAIERLGYSREELFAMTPQDLDEPGTYPTKEDIEAFQRHAREAGHVVFERVHVAKNGRHIPVEISSHVFELQGVEMMLSIVRDITDRKVAEQNLQQKTLLLDNIVENIPSMIFVKRAPDLRFEMFNRAGEELVGRSRNDLLGHNDYDFFPKEEADFFTSKDREVLGQRELVDIAEEPISTPAGIRILHTRKIALRNEQGEPQYLLGISEDITEQKKYEDTLRASEARLQATLDNSPYLIWQKDAEGRYIAANLPFIRMTGLKQLKDIVGKTDFDLWPRELAEKYRYDDAEVMELRQQKVVEEQVTDGKQLHWVETFKTPILDNEGRLLGTTGFAQDITERRQYIEGLRKAQELAEEIATTKSNFLANMSHEIRTPMNAIIGLSQLALNKQLSTEVRSYLGKILDSSGSLMDILNDILDLSKIEAGRITIEQAPFNLDTILENLNSLFASRAENKFLDFHIDVSPDVPHNLVGDALRLQQVLSNLVGNAIKFTEHGKIALDIRSWEVSKDKVRLLFSVEDTGIGIAKENLDKLFVPFSQVDSSITRRFGGTGLGLAISNDLLKLMGSSFRVESSPGKGSTFSFELTLDVASSAAHKQGERRKRQRKAGALASGLRNEGLLLAGSHILVVEDDAINQQVVSEFLELANVTVIVANNGKEAIELLEHSLFDAVLMDVHMPVMNGIEATQHIRRQSRFARLPIIALTADITTEARGNYLSYGMNDFVAKPIDPEALIATLVRWIRPVKEEIARAHAVAALEKQEAGIGPDLDSLTGFDFSNLLKMVSGNHQLVAELLFSFKDNTIGTPGKIEAKVNAGDFPAARELAHKLKGTASNLGAKDLHAATAQLERELNAGQCAPGTFAAFQGEFNRTISAITGLRQYGSVQPAPGQYSETIVNIAHEIDRLLRENSFVASETLNKLKANLPGSKLEQFVMLQKCVNNIEYVKARQVLRALVELPGIQES